MGCVVGRLQDLAAHGKLLVDVAKIADRFSGLPDRIDQFFLEQLGVVAGVWTVVPVDFQLLAALEGRPGAVGNDGHTPQRLKHVGRLERIDRHGLLNAADLQRLFIIERFDLAAVHRRVFNRGEDHAVSMGIHAKDGLACADVAQIVNALVFSDVSPRCGGLELQFLTLRHRQATGGRGERSVASAAAARPMNDFVELSGALRSRRLSTRRRRP